MSCTVLSPPRTEAVVLMYGFLAAKPKQLQKYADIYLKKNCTVIHATASITTNMFRNASELTRIAMDSSRKAASIIRELEAASSTIRESGNSSESNDDKKKIPIIVHSFSNGGAFVSERLTKLIRKSRETGASSSSYYGLTSKDWNDLILVGDRIHDIGYEVLDSAPAYLDESTCYRAVDTATYNNLPIRMILKAFLGCTIGYKRLLNTLRGKPMIKVQFWNNMIESNLCKRQAFVYSTIDQLTDAVWLDEFIKIRKSRGIEIVALKFEDSEHVLHLRKYPTEYANLLDKVVTTVVSNSR